VEVFGESDATETAVHGERELDFGTPIRGHLDVIPALMQVPAQMDSVGLHATEARREFRENEQEPQRRTAKRAAIRRYQQLGHAIGAIKLTFGLEPEGMNVNPQRRLSKLADGRSSVHR